MSRLSRLSKSPRSRHAPVRFLSSRHYFMSGVLTVCEEEVEGGETHITATVTLRPHTSIVGSPDLRVSTGQDFGRDLEAQPVDDVGPISCCCIPSGVFRPSTSMRGGSNIDHLKRDVKDTTGYRPTQAEKCPSQAETKIRAYFLTIAKKSLA